MNLLDSAFLCLDIGTHGVRGMAHRVRNANIDKSAFFTVENSDTAAAINQLLMNWKSKSGDILILHILQGILVHLNSW